MTRLYDRREVCQTYFFPQPQAATDGREGRSPPGAARSSPSGPNLHGLVLFEQGDHNDIQWINAGAYQAALVDFMNALGGVSLTQLM